MDLYVLNNIIHRPTLGKIIVQNNVMIMAIICTLSLLSHQAVGQSDRRDLFSDSSFSNNNNNPNSRDESDLIWQPLRSNLRSSFRPINSGSNAPTPPEPPIPPSPPSLPEALALIRGDSRRPIENSFTSLSSGDASRLESIFSRPANLVATTISSSTTPSPITTLAFEEDEPPTRSPMNRFRPTRAPLDDSENDRIRNNNNGLTNLDSNSNARGNNRNTNSRLVTTPETIINGGPSLEREATSFDDASSSNNNSTSYQINNECFECICEASTNCNLQSRCQTSDVRHTRCGLFLITYDQWLASGLSKQLVTPEALARDIAADERAYYECVISRDCAEQLITAYMANNLLDCDKDGRINCYDVAAIHQAGPDKCRSEAMLESQYWSDFNACYGFARR